MREGIERSPVSIRISVSRRSAHRFMSSSAEIISPSKRWPLEGRGHRAMSADVTTMVCI